MQQSAVIEYNHDGYLCEGFAVWDAAGPNRPGILAFPEWVGVGEYTQKRAQMLSELGFNTFVVDVYGKGIRPNTPSACEAEMMKYATNRPLLRQRARCGLDELRKVPKTDLGRMAAIGYCFGGMTVLEMARDDRMILRAWSASMACWLRRLRSSQIPTKARSWRCTELTIRWSRTIRQWRSGRRCAMPRRIASSSRTEKRSTPSQIG